MSVLGQSFSADLLADVLEDVPEEHESIWLRLEPFIVHDAFGNLSFRNALLRDCAYNGLSFRLRRELHSRAGDTIARATAQSGDDQSGLLSFHYLHAQRSQEAWSYSLQAAAQAQLVPNQPGEQPRVARVRHPVGAHEAQQREGSAVQRADRFRRRHRGANRRGLHAGWHDPGSVEASELAERLLTGDRRALARAITLVQDEDPSAWELVRAIYPHTGNAAIIGFTGPPGAGK